MRERLVVIGNGMAGVRTVEELLKLAPARYDITVLGAEPHGNYNRIQLSPVLAGEKKIEDIITHPREWYAQSGITLHTNDPVTSVDCASRSVQTLSGRRAQYDRLLIATGSQPFVLPVPGRGLPGVVAFRTIEDVEVMLDAVRQHKRAVVIGGGLLGLECANGLARQGMEVTLVHLMDWLMERQLDPVASGLLQASLETRGLRFKLKAQTDCILGEERVTGVRFKDGSEVAADLVVMAAGIVPDIALAKAAGLVCERGLVVDDALCTSDPAVFAVGECAQHRKICYGLVAPLWEQARVIAARLADDSTAVYQGSVVSTRLKVTGIDLFSAGNFMGDDGTDALVFRDPRRGIYKKLVLRDGRIDGAVLYGDVQDGGWYFDLLQSKQNVSAFRDRLLFGRRFVEARAA